MVQNEGLTEQDPGGQSTANCAQHQLWDAGQVIYFPGPSFFSSVQ